MNYLLLLEHLGPTPKFGEVGEFLGLECWEVTMMVKRGELEAIQTTSKRRICLNSLAEYLGNREQLPYERSMMAAGLEKRGEQLKRLEPERAKSL